MSNYEAETKELVYVHVFFDFRMIKKRDGVRRRDEVMEIVNREFEEKIEPVIRKPQICLNDENGYFAFYVWNDEGTRVIGDSVSFYTTKEDYKKLTESLKDYEVGII